MDRLLSAAAHQFPRKLGEGFQPPCGDHVVLLNAQPANPRQIHPGLQSDYHPFLERHVIARDDVRPLDVLEAQGVATVEVESGAETGVGDWLEQRREDVAGADARPGGLLGSLEATDQRIMRALLLRRGPPDAEGARRIPFVLADER